MNVEINLEEGQSHWQAAPLGSREEEGDGLTLELCTLLRLCPFSTPAVGQGDLPLPLSDVINLLWPRRWQA